MNDDTIMEHVKDILKPFDLKLDEYKSIMNEVIQTMEKGLNLKTRAQSSIKMYPSFVTKLPNNTENGQFLALDLGGTNYRVLLVTLSGPKTPPTIEERTYAIPRDKMLGNSKDLFSYIATTLNNFLKRFGLENKQLSLGFTFSFPCEQYDLNKSLLVRWTKGFDVKDAINSDIVKLLQDAINETGLNVKCVAIVNDTVGTLASCALEDPSCAIGLIVGTGTNAAYIEKIESVEFMKTSSDTSCRGKNEDSVVINMEWGAFGESGELNPFLTEFDKLLNKESLHPGKQIFEKMVSGMYLGELVRCVLIRLVDEKLVFGGEMPELLRKPNSFHTKYISETEKDPAHLFYSTHYILTEDLEVPIVEPVDDRIVRQICELISKRSAYLVGAGIAAILHRLNRPKVTIGIDGSLYKFHPKFRERMTDIIDKLKPKHTQFRLRLSEDGSGKGAAAIAAAATRPNGDSQSG